jgi:shikimate dehydrogenase
MIERSGVRLIGHPVSHSLSPAMQNAALASAGIPLRYDAVDVDLDDVSTVLDSFKRNNIAGNITVPHKRRAMSLMQKLTPVATRAGAVNTFWTDDEGELAGDNTDVAGFNELIWELCAGLPESARVAVFGAGGAAAAVVTALEKWPDATASVHARDLSQASAMQMRHSVVVRACSMRDPCLSDANVVVNATTVGIGDRDEIPIGIDRLRENAVVVDLNYGKRETRFVRDARERGHPSADGLRMLLYQGAASFHRWFGIDADTDAMWRALLKETGRAS